MCIRDSYQAAFTMTSLLVPTMVARATDCHVVNVTSAASEVGFRGAVGYATARWAVRGFSRMLAQDLKQLGIGVTHLNAAEISGTSYFSDAPGKAGARAAKESEIPNFKGSFLGRFPLVSADFWTSDHLSERSRSVGAGSGTRARGTLTLKRR